MLPQPTILCVDDDEINRQVFSYWLRRANYNVLEAATGTEALAHLAATRPDLVVLDVNLPDMSGFEVCRRLRLAAGNEHAMVLFISAVHVAAEDRTTGLEQGADGYLIKPIQDRELVAQVKAMLRMKKAEAASRLAAQEWRATFDAISDAVCLVDAEGRILRGNRALVELARLDFNAVIGRSLRDVLRNALVLPDDIDIPERGRGRDRQVSEHLLGGRWFRFSADSLFDDHGGCRGGVVILTDVTAHKQLEEVLEQRRHLESVGRLAGGVAHDFNNLLTTILGNASLLLRGTPISGEAQQLVGSIERSAWRAAELTRQLLGFSGQTLLWLRSVDPGKILVDAERVLRRKASKDVRLSVRSGEAVQTIRADADQLQQVLLQMAYNSFDALPHGGEVRLEAENVERRATESGESIPERVGSFVRLSVTDNGVGIPADVVGKIFDPFFTTKPLGQGTGLGLAMAHGIVRQHNGWIECVSTPGLGTRFDIYLPRAASEKGDRLRPRTGTVLVVDDNPILCNLASAYLREGGYDVITAGSHQEAYANARGKGDCLGVVVADAGLTERGPTEFLAEMRRLVPDISVVLASETHGGGDDGGGDFFPVARPYREKELLSAVQSALGAV